MVQACSYPGMDTPEPHGNPSPHTFHPRVSKPYPKHSFPPSWKGQAQRSQKTDFFFFFMRAKYSQLPCPAPDPPATCQSSQGKSAVWPMPMPCSLPGLALCFPYNHRLRLDLQPDPTKDATASRSTQLEIWAWICSFLSAAARVLIFLETGVKLQPECAVLC